MSATRRSWEFDEVCTAIRTSFPGCPPDRWSHGTFGVDELEDRPEDELQDDVDFGGDTEFESEIEAIVGALETMEESDGTDVFATWKQTRTAMTQEKLNRGLRTPVYQHSNSTSVTKHVAIPDLAKLAGRTRCYNCREIEHFSRNCPKRRVQTLGTDAGVQIVSCELELMATADVLGSQVTFGETCEGGTMETHFVGTQRGGGG